MLQRDSRRTVYQGGRRGTVARAVHGTAVRAWSQGHEERVAPVVLLAGERALSEEVPMRISELMKKDVETIDADECLRAAAERMRTCYIGALPVTENGQLVGQVSGRKPTRDRFNYSGYYLFVRESQQGQRHYCHSWP